MSQSSEMRTRLETAIRSNQVQQREKAESAVTKQLPTAVKPTIKLKTDFRNFAA